MYNTSVIVRSLIGPGHGRIRVLVACVDVTARLLFEQGIPMDDISDMKDVYAQVAKSLGKTTNAVSRNAERMANLCWEMSSPQRLEQMLDRSPKELPLSPAPRTILIYLAVYSYLGSPYFEAIDDHPEVFI